MTMAWMNPQVTDATTITNVSVVSMAPAMAMASLYMNLAYSISMAAMNAVYAQQQGNMVQQAAMLRGVIRVMA